MAGMGTRLRPLTLITPKPLLKLSGKTILERIIENISTTVYEPITDIAFIVGKFSDDIINQVKNLPIQKGINLHIFVQSEPLGTAHAIYQAKSLLTGSLIIAYADTIFESDFKLNRDFDGIILTKQVQNPEIYGVVKKENEIISKFVEKPKTFISDEAIIGVYYFKKAELLLNKIEYLLNNNLKENNEFQITNALQMLLDDNQKFSSQKVTNWLDCGTLEMLLNTNKHLLETKNFVSNDISQNNSIILEPCYFGNNVKIINSIIGPYTTIEDNCIISDSILSNSIILNNSNLKNVNLVNSIIGNNSNVFLNKQSIYIGDYAKVN